MFSRVMICAGMINNSELVITYEAANEFGGD